MAAAIKDLHHKFSAANLELETLKSRSGANARESLLCSACWLYPHFSPPSAETGLRQSLWNSRSLKLHLASHTQHPWCALIRTVVIHWSQQSFSSSNVWLEWIPVACSIYYIGEKNISSPPLSIPPLRSEGRNVKTW